MISNVSEKYCPSQKGINIKKLNKKSSRVISIDFNTPCLFRSATAFSYLFLHYISSSNRMWKQLIAIFNYNQFDLRKEKFYEFQFKAIFTEFHPQKKSEIRIQRNYQIPLKERPYTMSKLSYE